MSFRIRKAVPCRPICCLTSAATLLLPGTEISTIAGLYSQNRRNPPPQLTGHVPEVGNACGSTRRPPANRAHKPDSRSTRAEAGFWDCCLTRRPGYNRPDVGGHGVSALVVLPALPGLRPG